MSLPRLAFEVRPEFPCHFGTFGDQRLFPVELPKSDLHPSPVHSAIKYGAPVLWRDANCLQVTSELRRQTAVPSVTSRSIQPSMVVGLVSGTGVRFARA
jgi:hypothetical protein